MSTLLAPGQLVQLRVWTAMIPSRQAAVNSAWYQVSAVGSSPATDEDFALQMDSVVAPAYKPILNNLATYRGCQATIHSAIPPFPALFVAADAAGNIGPGTAGAVPLPLQTCGILRFKTNRPGPSGRGRWYLAFPAQAQDTGGGSPDATYGALGLTLGSEVGVGVAVSAGGRTAVLVRVIVHGPNKLGIFPSPTPVDSFLMDDLWATQRRRGSFGRSNLAPF